MSYFFFLGTAVAFFLSASVFFALTLYWSYKHEAFRGVFFSICRAVLAPAGLIMLWFGIMISVLFTDDSRPHRLGSEIMLIIWCIGSFIPFGITAVKGIKEKNKAQIQVGLWGLATIASFIAALVCFAYFGSACT